MKKVKKQTAKKPARRGPKGYDWDKWFSKKRFVLEYGKHYSCMPHSMMVQIRRAALARGIPISIKVLGVGKFRVEIKR